MKFKHGAQLDSSSWGVLKRSEFDRINDKFISENYGIFDMQSLRRTSFGYGSNSWLAVIEIVLDLKAYAIKFSRLDKAATIFNTFNLNKDEEYYFAICWLDDVDEDK